MQNKLKIMVLTAEDSLKVFRMTPERIEAALERFPEFRGKVEISITRTSTSFENDPSWNSEDYEKFRRDIVNADILVGYMFPLAEVAALAPNLKWIHIIGAGIEHLLPLDWLPEGCVLTNNRGAHAPKTCEYAMMALLMLANHMPRLACAQQKRKWDAHFVSVIRGSKAAILGAGKQGSAVALAAKRLGLDTVGVDIDTSPRENFDEILPPSRLNEALGSADYVVVTLPSTKDTYRFIGEKEFAAMKEGAGFINISRGRIVDSEALVASLKSGHLSGAVLDVFEQEPLPVESPLWSAPNLTMSPHMGCDDEDNYIHRTFDIVFENLRRLDAGERLENVVDRKKGY
jgi:phosphoglycerate dehydrogenase-like enzyme